MGEGFQVVEIAWEEQRKNMVLWDIISNLVFLKQLWDKNRKAIWTGKRGKM